MIISKKVYPIATGRRFRPSIQRAFSSLTDWCEEQVYTAETQQRRNDSSQVSACFHQEDHSPQDNGHTSGKGVTAEDRASGAAAAGPARSDGGDTGSSCCPLHELKRLPECGVTLGELRFSDTHTVLIDVPYFNGGFGIVPQDGRDIWHRNFVKMPCSTSCTITKSGFMSSGPVLRWSVISKQLKALENKKDVAVEDVKKAILKYNPKYDKQWSFEGLADFINKWIPKDEGIYYSSLFSKIAALALRLPKLVKKAVPLLRSGSSASITLSQLQIACLLANAFFCTYPHRNTSRPNSEYWGYPTINFNSLFENGPQRKKEKLRAVMHYFKVVTETEPSGLVTFERRCITDLPSWRNANETLNKLHVTARGCIEGEGTGMLQVDFAASLIGGGVLGSGLVQEEILFLINPELIVSRLFTQKLEDNECLIITGSQQFSHYSGFRDSFEWSHPCEDTVKKDKWCRMQRQIVAIDALQFKHRSEQFNMRKVVRELNKAYCGFRKHGDEPDIATGKWGCGAFHGDAQLKALIQLMAAAKAKRGLAFFTFRDEKLQRELEQTYNLLLREKVTVGRLFELIGDYCDLYSHPGLFEFIRKRLAPPSRSLL